MGDIPNIFSHIGKCTGRKKKEEFSISDLTLNNNANNSNDVITAIIAFGALRDEDMSTTRKKINNNNQRPATIAITINIEMQKLNKTKCKFLSFARHISSISIWKTILCFFVSFSLVFCANYAE